MPIGDLSTSLQLPSRSTGENGGGLCTRFLFAESLLNKAVRAAYAKEALASDKVCAYYRVVHKPLVAVRAAPSLDAPIVGAKAYGQHVAAEHAIQDDMNSRWIQLLSEDEPVQDGGDAVAARYMLVDGAGTKVSHLGALLEHVSLPLANASIVAADGESEGC